MGTKRSGGCICGKVRFHIENAPDTVSVCHCALCRRWASGPMHAVHLSSGQVVLEQDDSLAWYDSSDWAKRGFCSACGSSLFYRLKVGNEEFVVSAGALDDVSGMTFANQIFIDEKPGYYDFAGDIPAMTGPEVFAMFADDSTEEGTPS